MKKILICILSLAISICYLPNMKIIASEKETLENGNIVTICNDNDVITGEIETIYLDNGINKYGISEFGDSYDLIIDTVNNKVFINKFELSMDTYKNLIGLQASDIDNSNIKKSLLRYVQNFKENPKAIENYEEKHVRYKYNIEHHIHDLSGLRCTTYPLHTISVPTTNYSSKEYFVNSYVTSEVVEKTVNSIVRIANLLTFGVTELAKQKVVALLNDIGSNVINAQISYNAYQSLYNVCPKAVKETRLGTIKDKKTGKFVDSTAYNYFYSSKP